MNNSNRLIKPSRRRLSAEVNLIIVIIIISSWSIYALYRLTLASGDYPMALAAFGSGSGSGNATTITAANSSNNQQQAAGQPEGQLLLSPQQQLAMYKSQILKELLERQRELLNDLRNNRQPPSAGLAEANPNPNMNLAQATSEDQMKLAQWQTGAPRINGLPLKHSLASREVGSPSELIQATFGPDDPTLSELAGGLEAQAEFHGRAGERSRPSKREFRRARHYESSRIRQDGRLAESQRGAERRRRRRGRRTRTRRRKPSRAQLQEQANLDAEYEPLASRDLRDYEEPGARDPRPMDPVELDDDSGTETTTTLPVPSTTESPTTTTTTEEPPISDQIEQEISTRSPNKWQDRGDSSETTQDEESDRTKATDNGNSPEEQEPDEEAMQRIKKTVSSIDDEVDRMSQPSSSGAISLHRGRQEHDTAPAVNYKNTVQFDDAPLNQTNQMQPTPKTRDRTNTNKQQQQQQRLTTSSPDDLVTEHDRLATKLSPGGARNSSNVIPALNELIMNAHNRRGKRSIAAKPRDRTKRLPAGRRNDLEDDQDDDDDDQDNDGRHHDDPQLSEADVADQQPRAAARGSLKGPADDQQLTMSHDPSLSELLAHKQLLDALQKSRLPAPVVADIPTLASPANTRSNLTSAPGSSLLLPARSVSKPDHQPADSELFTVDQGLLLYPAEDEQHHYKKEEKKSSHMKKKKEKKKTHVAMKKGGHKKKKHKKEEKKYHKEKKFKGAKKGKKMKKGKGSKGGKKGSKYYKDKGFKKKGFKNIYVKNEFGQKKSYFDEFRDKDFKKKWKNFDDKYNYAQMKKWQAKELKGAKKMKHQGEKMKKYDKSKWKKNYAAQQESEASKKKKKMDEFR